MNRIGRFQTREHRYPTDNLGIRGRIVWGVNKILGSTVNLEEIYRDGLTGLYNKRKFESDFDAFVASGKNGYLLLIDFDKFKELNDDFGYIVGDETLKLGSGVIQRTLRLNRGDRIYRIGGEKFAVLAEWQMYEYLLRG